MALLYKNKKEGGSARASPVAAPMPKSVSFRETKGECVAYEDVYQRALRTFHRWDDMVFIVDVQPVGR